MATKIVKAAVDPAEFRGLPPSYPAWIMSRLRAQGVRFEDGAPRFHVVDADVERYIQKPWVATVDCDGIICVCQRQEVEDVRSEINT